jgi:hypothetical protein
MLGHPPLSLTVMTKKFESRQLGHFRYSLHKITPHEKRKEGKPRGKPPPPPPQKKKKEENKMLSGQK